MSDTSEKARALVLSLLMVTSVLTAAVAFSGGAGAADHSPDSSGGISTMAPPTNVADSTGGDIVVPGERTTVADITFGNAGNVSDVIVDLAAGNESDNLTADEINTINVTLFDGAGNVVNTSGNVNYGSHPKTVSFGSNQTGVERVEVRAETTLRADDGDVIDAVVSLIENGTGNTTTVDTLNNQTISAETGARLRGEVVWQNGTPADNVTIDVVDLAGNVVINNITTRGFNTSQPGLWGPRVASPGNYTVRLDPDDPLNGTVDVFSTNVELDSGETEKIETTLDPIRLAQRGVCSEVESFVGQGGTFTITVFAEDGGVLPGASVRATSKRGSPAINLVNNVTKNTDTNGQVEYDVTGSATGVASWTFNISKPGSPDPQVQCTAIFFRNGEGTIEGEVYNEETTQGLANASVWTVQAGQYRINERYTRIDLSNFGGDDDPFIWVRLVDNETNEIIDNDEYDFRNEEFNLTGVVQDPNSDTGVRPIEELNVTDSREGQGYVVHDQDGDGLVAFNHTRLDNREYYVQISFDAWNATNNDTRYISDKQSTPDGEEDFHNVTTVSLGGQRDEAALLGTTHFTSPPVTVYSPPTDMTLENTMRLANLSRANLVDSHGYFNYPYEQNTLGTDSEGEFHLSRLYADFQAGREYVAIATKPGFSTDFADVFVEEDGDFRLGVDSNDEEALTLRPEPVDAELNITNVGLLKNASVSPEDTQNLSAYDFSQEFSNKSDLFNQRVPRDGATVDVVLVETTVEGSDEPISREVTLQVPDDSEAGVGGDNFQGQWIVPSGVTLVSSDPVNDTVTIETGSDGRAVVWLQMDFSTEDLEQTLGTGADIDECRDPDFVGAEEPGFSGITGVVTTDLAATDATCKLFSGVTSFREASLSGILTDNRDVRVDNTFVYVRNMRFPLGLFGGSTDTAILRPEQDIRDPAVDPRNTTWTIQHWREGGDETPPGVPADDDDGIDDTAGDDTGVLEREYDLRGERTGVPVAEISDIDGEATFEFGANFPEIDSRGPFKLAELSPEDDSEFTLKDVPAVPPSTGGDTTGYDVRGVALNESLGATNETRAIGNATAATKPGFTDDANIAFPFQAPEDAGSSPSGVDVNGDGSPSQDSDGDGLHEDVNGDGTFTIADVQLLFNARNSNVVQNNGSMFDFNGDTTVSIADVQALFQMQQGS